MSAPILAFIDNCPVDPETNQPSSTCENLVIQFAVPGEDPQTTANLIAVQNFALKSIDITAPLYLALFGVGVFRRYILARI